MIVLSRKNNICIRRTVFFQKGPSVGRRFTHFHPQSVKFTRSVDWSLECVKNPYFRNALLISLSLVTIIAIPWTTSTIFRNELFLCKHIADAYIDRLLHGGNCYDRRTYLTEKNHTVPRSSGQSKVIVESPWTDTDTRAEAIITLIMNRLRSRIARIRGRCRHVSDNHSSVRLTSVR